MKLEINRSKAAKAVVANTEVSAEALCAKVLESIGKSLEVRVLKLKADLGIMYHEGVPYVWELTWHAVEREVDFQLTIWKVVPVLRNGKARTDKKPKLVEVCVRHFQSEV